MKSITIFQENIDKIILYDKDDTPLDEYIKDVSSIFEISNATVLETSESIIILRPHKLVSVEVKEVKQAEKVINNDEITEEEDIITDGD